VARLLDVDLESALTQIVGIGLAAGTVRVLVKGCVDRTGQCGQWQCQQGDKRAQPKCILHGVLLRVQWKRMTSAPASPLTSSRTTASERFGGLRLRKEKPFTTA